jgi:DNA modification methylase
MTDTIINRDCLEALREIPDNSIHCCVTSPPYYALRDYGVDGRLARKNTRAVCSAPDRSVFRGQARFASRRNILLNISDTYPVRAIGRLSRPQISERQNRAGGGAE